MSYVLGLTGSIGMGKSTTAAMLQDLGLPLWDADAVVHGLYDVGGAAVDPVAALCPQAGMSGRIDRDILRSAVAAQPGLLGQIQAIVHPLVADSRAQFLAASTAPIVVLDIPLLFEIGADALCNGIIVVTAPPDVQRARVLARGVDEAMFQTLLARQMPDAEKRARATWVIETLGLDHVRAQLKMIVSDIEKAHPNA
jgi:dephospho-CoA kinase